MPGQFVALGRKVRSARKVNKNTTYGQCPLGISAHLLYLEAHSTDLVFAQTLSVPERWVMNSGEIRGDADAPAGQGWHHEAGRTGGGRRLEGGGGTGSRKARPVHVDGLTGVLK